MPPRARTQAAKTYALLTKREVKMAGYILAKFFFAFFMDRDEVEVHKNANKNEANIYPAILTEQAWSLKDLLYGQNITPTEFRLCGTNAGNPERARLGPQG